MSTLDVGPWVLLSVGTVILLGAVWAVFKGKQAKSVWMMWVIGFAASGVGIYGPAFLGQYADFVKVLMQLQSAPSQETYAAALNDVGTGKFPAAYDSVIVQLALSQPVDGMDSLIQSSIGKAKDEEGKKILTDAAASWTAKKATASEIGRHIKTSPEGEEKLKALDPVTRSLVARSLLQQPAASTDTGRISRTALKRFSTFPTSRGR